MTSGEWHCPADNRPCATSWRSAGPGWTLKTRFNSSSKGAPKMSTNSARWLPMIASKPLSSSVASSRRLVGSAPWALRICRRLGSNCGISKYAADGKSPWKNRANPSAYMGACSGHEG